MRGIVLFLVAFFSILGSSTASACDRKVATTGAACSVIADQGAETASFMVPDAVSQGGPAFLVIRMGRFESLEIAYDTQETGPVSLDLFPADFTPVGRGTYVSTPLPADIPSGTRIDVTIEQPLVRALVTQGFVTGDLREIGWSFTQMVIVSMALGAVTLVMLFDLAFTAILRLRFTLWHALMCLGIIVCMGAGSGIASQVFPLGAANSADGIESGYAIVFAASGPFTIYFLERWALSAILRKALVAASLMCAGVALPMGLHPQWLSGVPHLVYFIACLPLCIVTVVSLGYALARGSIWVRYQIVAWTGAIVAILDAAAASTGLTDRQFLDATAPYLAMSFETLVTAMGVGHRLLLLRRSNDRAHNAARLYRRMAHTDPLTGLYNRRGIEKAFAKIIGGGSHMVALVDLDDFKSVNDRFGHVVGDDTLRAAAQAFTAEQGLVAARMGGEEFLVFFRPGFAVGEAELVRASIVSRVGDVLGQRETQVTASMGLVDFGDILPDHRPDLGTLVARADAALYRAKRQGKDRMHLDRIELLDPTGESFAGARQPA